MSFSQDEITSLFKLTLNLFYHVFFMQNNIKYTYLSEVEV